MKYYFVILILLCLNACTETVEKKVASLEKANYSPTSDKTNKLKLGQTIYFETAITEGIDRSKYPAPINSKEIDKAFFEFIKDESINDGAAGGRTYTFNIYKAIKKGTTQITETHYTPLPRARNHNDTAKLKTPDTTIVVYNFVIQ